MSSFVFQNQVTKVRIIQILFSFCDIKKVGISFAVQTCIDNQCLSSYFEKLPINVFYYPKGKIILKWGDHVNLIIYFSMQWRQIKAWADHTTYSRNNIGQKCEGNCGLWVLNEIIKRMYPESLKKIVGAVWELPAK